MALPLIAAGIAARTIGTKLATRIVGGIVGAGAKNVNSVYKNTNAVASVLKNAPVTRAAAQTNVIQKRSVQTHPKGVSFYKK